MVKSSTTVDIQLLPAAQQNNKQSARWYN